MPITGRWYDDTCTVYCLTFTGRWSAEMYRTQVDIATREIELQPHPVDVIFDMLQSGLPPLNIYAQVHDTHQHHARNLRFVIVIVAGGVIRNTINFAIRATRDESLNVQVVASEAEALRQLARVRLDAERRTNSQNRP